WKGGLALRASSYMEGLLERLAHLVYYRLVVRLAVNGGTGNEGIGTSGGNLADIVLVDATVHFKANIETAVVDQATHLLQFFQRRRNEFLPAETRVHRHQQHHVELVHHIFETVGGGRRIEHQACLAALAAN